MRQERQVWKPITTITPCHLSAPYLRPASLETEAEAGLHGDRQAGNKAEDNQTKQENRPGAQEQLLG